ncbi:MAG: GAF domain-containing protein [Candidatus Eisenbacteria bacterium]|uniref:GAF domain-containing protein n=1 Tax=Eiseniibacteriota bacterium TaxID=2212470 RepID=A0A9D6L7G7_UNCEI|nr:GAF domain-containing protein [Candidatus Eisenbacteria bacterium]MBI3540031.1 GAF domain-containing protein [Candidatus Eisenbacteria bacterium]
MSRFDLRDVSERLSRSRDTKAVVFEFLRALDASRPDWRASLAFYEVSADAFVDVFEIEAGRLIRREIVVPANELPERLVRKLFDASAFFNAREKRSLFSAGLGAAPYYEAEERDASQLMPLTVLPDWRACICVPLGDQSDLMGILVLTSAKKNAFGGRAISEILPVKSLATAALANHLRRAAYMDAAAVRPAAETITDVEPAPVAPLKLDHVPAAGDDAREDAPAEIASYEEVPAPDEIPAHAEMVAHDGPAMPDAEPAIELRGQLEDLTRRSQHVDEENRAHTQMIENLTSEYAERQRGADEYREELDRVKVTMEELEEQTVAATEHLSTAYTELNDASWEMQDLERRVEFARRLLRFVSEEPDERTLTHKVVTWLCQEIGIDRCSLMTLDQSRETLEISAQCGLEADLVGRVHVRVGQGVSGWVAHNRKPLLVRMRSQADVTPEPQADTYNSPSFIAVPVVHNGRLYGVLNLSNKQGGELFNGVDFDCASLAGAVLAVRLASCEQANAASAWAA